MTKADGPQRADAQRNRDRLLAAAAELLAKRGIGVSMDEIARTAGVGSGTLYRHFPHKEELLSALVFRRFEKVSAVIDEAMQTDDAGVAFRTFLHGFAGAIATDRALTELIIAEHVLEFPELSRLRASAMRRVERLVDRARKDGAVRDDIRVDDLIPLVVAVARLPVPGMDDPSPDAWERYLTVVLDGLRPDPSNTPLPHQPQRRTSRT